MDRIQTVVEIHRIMKVSMYVKYAVVRERDQHVVKELGWMLHVHVANASDVLDAIGQATEYARVVDNEEQRERGVIGEEEMVVFQKVKEVREVVQLPTGGYVPGEPIVVVAKGMW